MEKYTSMPLSETLVKYMCVTLVLWCRRGLGGRTRSTTTTTTTTAADSTTRNLYQSLQLKYELALFFSQLLSFFRSLFPSLTLTSLPLFLSLAHSCMFSQCYMLFFMVVSTQNLYCLWVCLFAYTYYIYVKCFCPKCAYFRFRARAGARSTKKFDWSCVCMSMMRIWARNFLAFSRVFQLLAMLSWSGGGGGCLIW